MALRKRAVRDWASLLSAAIGFVTVVAYVVYVLGRGTGRDGYAEFAFLSGYFAALSAAAAMSSSAPGRRAIVLRSAATAGFLYWGLFTPTSLFGVPLFLAGIAVLVGLIRLMRLRPGSETLVVLVMIGTIVATVVGRLAVDMLA